MKLLILIAITLTINFSLMTKNSQISQQFSGHSVIDNIDKKTTELYIQGMNIVNNIKNSLLLKIYDYNQFIQVAILGKPNKAETHFILEKKSFLHSSGNNQTDISKKNYTCYL